METCTLIIRVTLHNFFFKFIIHTLLYGFYLKYFKVLWTQKLTIIHKTKCKSYNFWKKHMHTHTYILSCSIVRERLSQCFHDCSICQNAENIKSMVCKQPLISQMKMEWVLNNSFLLENISMNNIRLKWQGLEYRNKIALYYGCKSCNLNTISFQQHQISDSYRIKSK